ncbi:MAG: DUF5702 domain-containing protein [Roseburia sp.]|nr:DUF5702 domain-containing protein [Roseburia sp.]
MRARRGCPAYLTVYLALCLAVLTSLCLALIEGARSNAVRMETECITDIAMNSVLAEYHRELFRQYNIFALDSAYGTGLPGKVNAEGHLQYYLSANMSLKAHKMGLVADLFYRDMLALSPEDVEMTKVSILTDQNGAVFRRLAVEAVKEDTGLGALEELQQWLQTVEANDLKERNVAEEKAEIDEKIQNYDGMEIELTEMEAEGESLWETVEIENPTESLEKIRKNGILGMVMDNTENLSQSRLTQEQLVYERMQQGRVSIGNMLPGKQSEAEELAECLLFQEYLMRYMGHYGRSVEGDAEENVLQYQLEYLLAGRDSDRENLESVADLLCAFREAANAAYIMTDQVKREEADLLAAVLSAVLLIPELKDLFTASILLGWAYAESLYDVKQLLAGERVPLMKDGSNWHYSLEGALRGVLEEGEQSEEGLSYEDYLRIFLCLCDLDTVTGRAMNMVEADIRRTPGNSGFRLDGCYAGIEAKITVWSKYGYRYEIIREKGY